jgi:DNA-binding HxlR family transcriptional regulator
VNAPQTSSRPARRSRAASTPSVAGAAARRSPCPVACTLDLIGDRWTLLIVRDLFAGKTRFAEFARSPEGVASNILSSRLNELVADGLVERRVAPAGGHASYHLTARGASLEAVLVALRDWGLAHVEGAEARIEAGGCR